MMGFDVSTDAHTKRAAIAAVHTAIVLANRRGPTAHHLASTRAAAELRAAASSATSSLLDPTDVPPQLQEENTALQGVVLPPGPAPQLAPLDLTVSTHSGGPFYAR